MRPGPVPVRGTLCPDMRSAGCHDPGTSFPPAASPARRPQEMGMLTLTHHPTTPATGRPAPQPCGHGTDQPKKPAPPPADREERQTFLLILLRALGAIHS